MHTYQRDPQSGAGNCVCAFSENSAVHPHAFTQSARSERCVCTRPAGDRVHTDAATAVPLPVRTGLDGVQAAVRAARGGDAPVQIQGYA